MPLVFALAAVAAILLTVIIAAVMMHRLWNSKAASSTATQDVIRHSPQFVVPSKKYGSLHAENIQPSLGGGASHPELTTACSSSDVREDGSLEEGEPFPSKPFVSEYGVLQPELYPQQDDVLHIKELRQKTKKSGRGKVHIKLKYDFRTSDFVVRLVEATGLPSMDIGGYSDPYVKVYLEPDEEKRMKQSSVQRRTLNPHFDEVFKFPITYEELQEKTLCMKVFDFDKFSRHDAIGDVMIRMSDTNVSRQLDVWSDLTKPARHQEAPGDLLFSISYLPNAERLTVVALRARNLKAMDVNGLSDPFVKVALLHEGNRIKSKKTSIQYKDCDPVWNEAILFNIPFDQLNTHCLELQVYDHDVLSRDELIGETTAGEDSDEPGRSQWQDMIDFPRKPVAIWHPLRDPH